MAVDGNGLQVAAKSAGGIGAKWLILSNLGSIAVTALASTAVYYADVLGASVDTKAAAKIEVAEIERDADTFRILAQQCESARVAQDEANQRVVATFTALLSQ